MLSTVPHRLRCRHLFSYVRVELQVRLGCRRLFDSAMNCRMQHISFTFTFTVQEKLNHHLTVLVARYRKRLVPPAFCSFLARGDNGTLPRDSPVAKRNNVCIKRKQYHICLRFILIHFNTDVVSLFRVILDKYFDPTPLVGVILKMVALELNKLVKSKFAKSLSLTRVLPASPCQILLSISQ